MVEPNIESVNNETIANGSKLCGSYSVCSITARSTQWVVTCSHSLLENDSGDIERYDIGVIESLLGLGNTIQVESFQPTGKWLNDKEKASGERVLLDTLLLRLCWLFSCSLRRRAGWCT